MQLDRRFLGVGIALVALLAAAAPVLARTPEVTTWTKPVDTEYFDCGSFVAHGVWTVSHRLTTYFDKQGTPVRDHEIVDFVGAFVNPTTGASFPDSGRSVFFDTLTPDGDYLTTVFTGVRHSRYFHAAGRTDFQKEVHHGIDRFDASIAAACAALGD